MELLETPKLISRKIWVVEKCNVYIVAKSLSKNWNFGQFLFQMAIGNTEFRRISKPIVKNQWIWWKQLEREWKTLDWELTSNVTIKCDIKPKTFALGELVDGWIGHALPLIWISMATRQMTWKKVRIKLEILSLEFTVWKLDKIHYGSIFT